MTKLSNISKQVWSLAIALSVSTVAFAQSYYYDDDIYYDASKAKTEKKAAENKQSANRQSSYVVNGNANIADYPAADTYVVPAGSSLNIDVDTYNRRGQFLVSDTVYAENDGGGDFTFTQRIERFHNPDVVSGSDDEDLKEVYSYAMSQPQNINIYVIDNDPWNYFGPSWSWRYCNPWYWNAWYPSYSWGWNYWGWDPYWSWSWGSAWGPSWGLGWGPAYGPGWGPSWGPSWGWGPAQAWRPTTPSGSSRPHNYVGSGAIATHRPGSYSQSAMPSSTSRPGNMGRGRYGTSTSVNSSARPGNYTPAATGSQNNSTVNSSRPGNQGRGRAVMNNSNNNTNQNNNRNSYNNSNNYRSSQSSGSFRSSGGSSSRGYSGSHGSAGGGGGSRGRR